MCFSTEKYGIDWIKKNGDKLYVYVLRNRKGELLTSYCWKNKRLIWGPINRGGYYGGYRIGNPRQVCACGLGRCNDPLHPTYMK